MTITEAMKFTDLRITHFGRWLIWNGEAKTWRVYTRPHRARNTQLLIETESEDEAVKVLLGV